MATRSNGTLKLTNRMTNAVRRSGNRRTASAKAAGTLISRPKTVVPAATMTELSTARPTPAWKARWKFCRVSDLGKMENTDSGLR